MPVPSRPGARPVPGARRTRIGLAPLVALVVALALAILIVALSGASVASAATFTVEGTVRDDAGAPVAGRQVTVAVPIQVSVSSTRSEPHSARTGVDGHYVISDVPRPTEWIDESSYVVEQSDEYAAARRPDFAAAIKGLRGSTLLMDAVVRRRDAVLSGRVTVRDLGSPEGASVTAFPADRTKDFSESYTAQAAPDGTYRLAVPAGTYRTQASSTYGLGAWAPDMPEMRTDSPTVTLGHGGSRGGIDISLRRRLAQGATDEYGTFQPGYASGYEDHGDRYPIDPHRTVTATIGPRVKVLIDSGGSYNPLVANVKLVNTGDDDVFTGPIRIESRHRFDCFASNGSCDDRIAGVAKGSPIEFVVGPRPYGEVRDFDATVVVPTNTPSGTLRISIHIHDPNPTQAQMEQAQRDGQAALAAALTPKAPATHAPIPRPGAGGDVGRVLMTKNRLRVTFPGAGTASSIVDRAVQRKVRGKVKRRWRTVRRITLRTAAATTQVARMKRLTKGRYRVRTTYAIGTRAPRTTVTTWSIRR